MFLAFKITAYKRATHKFALKNRNASLTNVFYVFRISSSSLGEGRSWGEHCAWIVTKGRGTSNFSASVMHSASLSFGKLIWNVFCSEPNPIVIVITRIKALVIEISPARYPHHFPTQVPVSGIIVV